MVRLTTSVSWRANSPAYSASPAAVTPVPMRKFLRVKREDWGGVKPDISL